MEKVGRFLKKLKTELCHNQATHLQVYIQENKVENLRDITSAVLCFSLVTQSCPTLCNPHGLQHARPPCPSPTPGVYSNLCSLSRQCHPTISSSVIPFSSCLQTFPASGSFQMSQLFASSGRSIGISASASVLPMNIQPFTDRLPWEPL